MQTSLPRDETSFVFGPDGLLLLAPLPRGRWLSFQDLEEAVETISADEVVARIQVRLGGRWRPTDVAWLWLVLRGHARGSLLDNYALERTIADRHVLEVSDEVHHAIVDIADAVRQGREVPAENVDPVAAALQRNARAMIDVDYKGSPLVADHAPNGNSIAEPHPGQRYPDSRRPYRLPVPLCRCRSDSRTGSSPLLVSDSRPDHRSGLNDKSAGRNVGRRESHIVLVLVAVLVLDTVYFLPNVFGLPTNLIFAKTLGFAISVLLTWLFEDNVDDEEENDKQRSDRVHSVVPAGVGQGCEHAPAKPPSFRGNNR